MTLTVITQATEPIPTLAEVKSHLRVEHDGDDTDILSKIWGAITEFEDPKLGWLGTGVLPRKLRLSLDEFSTCIELVHGPVLIDGDHTFVIKYDDADGVEQTLSASVYRVDDPEGFCAKAVLKTDQSWPDTNGEPESVRVEYWVGYASDDIRANNFKSAVKLHVEMNYDREFANANTLAVTIRRLLQPYHRPTV